jgi:glycerol-3-phosphate dehydrogenase
MNSSRAETLVTACSEHWDLVVVGGGITGAGILREAARRQLKVLLLEQQDFAWGTSSRSSQMVHGGLKYLTQGHIKLTYVSVGERQNLMKELPGLVSYLGMMMATYKEMGLYRFVVQFGLVIYDLMGRKLLRHAYSANEIRRLMPGIREHNLLGGLLFNESTTDDARLTFRVLDQARDDGGAALNYCRVNDLIATQGRVTGVIAEDVLSGQTHTIRARQVINATGAWADRLRGKVASDKSKHMRPLRGSHLVFSADRIPLNQSVVLTHPVSKKPGFANLWEGRVIVGSTDIDHTENLDKEAAVTQAEVDYMLQSINHYFPELHLTEADIISSWSGVRPVVDSGNADPSRESRDHAVWNEEGLLTITGGKLTTFRVIALDALEAAQATLGPLPGLTRDQAIFDPISKIPSLPAEMSKETLAILLGRYGNKTQALLDAAQPGELETVTGTRRVWAELRWAAMHEDVHFLQDLMLRRTRLAVLLPDGGAAVLPRIRTICQPLMGWDDSRWNQEEAAYLALVRCCYSLPSRH